ncbi:MAG: hypothetical protein IAF58_14125, partial [Leptolyngbya sp.]|nr:hypothetical protein [Candidatus Melainabacteria bacterium]
MKRLSLVSLSLMAVLGSASLLATPVEARQYGVNQRQNRQQGRIYNGVNNGSLNRRESARLGQQQFALNRREQRFRASGNGLNASERYRLNNQQNNLSQNIYQQKHDSQNFHGGGYGGGNGPRPNNPGNSLYDVNQTQQNQDKRIYNGVQNGQLTQREAQRLDNQQDRFDTREAQMRASGNGLSISERARLDAHQDRLSQNIYQQKHDSQNINSVGSAGGSGPRPNNAGNSLFDVNQTQQNQDKRIYNGIQNGQLTQREAQRLDNQQDRFDTREAQMRASGNGLSLSERARLDAQQDRMSRSIYNQKHDNQN